MRTAEMVPAVYLLFNLDTKPISRCVHPAKSFLPSLKLQPIPGEQGEEPQQRMNSKEATSPLAPSQPHLSGVACAAEAQEYPQ